MNRQTAQNRPSDADIKRAYEEGFLFDGTFPGFRDYPDTWQFTDYRITGSTFNLSIRISGNTLIVGLLQRRQEYLRQDQQTVG